MKIPEHSEDQESAILGAIMLEAGAYDRVAPILRVDDFYSDANQNIYQAIRNLVGNGRKIDITTVVTELKRMGVFSKDNGLDGKMALLDVVRHTNAVTSSAHIEDHARDVKGMSQKRKLAIITGKFHQLAYAPTERAEDLLNAIQAEISEIAQEGKAGDVQTAKQVMTDVWDGMKEAAASTGELLGSPTGIGKLDELTLGFTEPDFIILAGGPGEGKSTLALQMAKNMSLNGIPIGVFSLEMINRQLGWKLLSSEIDEDIKTIRMGKLQQRQWDHALEQRDRIGEAKLFLYDKGGLSVFDFESIVRMMVKKHKVKGVFVDYIQLMNAIGANRRFGTREEELNFISKRIKVLCKDLRIWIVALSQLSRMEKGTKRLYRKSDLRESGALEQDADGIVFVYRPHYHDQESMNIGGEQMYFNENDVLYLIDKWRLGVTGIARGKFNGRFNRFEDFEKPFSAPGLNFYEVEKDPF